MAEGNGCGPAAAKNDLPAGKGALQSRVLPVLLLRKHLGEQVEAGRRHDDLPVGGRGASTWISQKTQE